MKLSTFTILSLLWISVYGQDSPNSWMDINYAGPADPLVPHCQSEMLYKALQENAVKSDFVLVANAGQLGLDQYEKKLTYL